MEIEETREHAISSVKPQSRFESYGARYQVTRAQRLIQDERNRGILSPLLESYKAILDSQLGHRQMMNPSVMNLQHRLVLELSVGLSFDQRQAQWRID